MTTIRILTRLNSNVACWRNVLQQKQCPHWHTGSLLRTGVVACDAKYNNKNSTQSHFGIRNNLLLNTPAHFFSTKKCPDQAGKTDDRKQAAITEEDLFGDSSQLGLFAKFKLMYKKYWYVLLPVHIVTSLGWLGCFYYLSKSGVDVPALLQYLHVSDTIIAKVQNSAMGHLAIAYLCYKVATPLRYAVTLGGTTISIKHLVQMGYIKPMPTKKEIMQMYEDRKVTRAAKAKEKEDAEASQKQN